MITCTACGYDQNSDNTEFCNACGSELQTVPTLQPKIECDDRESVVAFEVVFGSATLQRSTC
jgi:rRNA maturation endonuclease Nob1